MPVQSPVEDLAHAIQLSVAPVFLLTGVGAILGVLTNRLARIIDRTRVLEEENPAKSGRDPAMARAELAVLRQRALLINRAISLCTFSALLVAGVVASLFLGTFVRMNIGPPIAATFVFAMLTLMLGLITFLREVHAAIRFLRTLSADGRR
jgi:Protein of unknown function (DUF2721)